MYFLFDILFTGFLTYHEKNTYGVMVHEKAGTIPSFFIAFYFDDPAIFDDLYSWLR